MEGWIVVMHLKHVLLSALTVFVLSRHGLVPNSGWARPSLCRGRVSCPCSRPFVLFDVTASMTSVPTIPEAPTPTTLSSRTVEVMRLNRGTGRGLQDAASHSAGLGSQIFPRGASELLLC